MRPILAKLVMILFSFITVSARAEIIHVRDYVEPKVMPKPSADYDPRRLPEYSSAAIEHDAWVRAWLLLDVDAKGTVLRFKFLRKPGYDLAPIAASEAWKLSFEPARDNRDKPIGTLVVWSIEWPSYWWLSDLYGSTLRLPMRWNMDLMSPMSDVPCAGDGPLNLGSQHPVYRDCAGPNMSLVNTAPWITRPGS
ncbi:MAG TPA: hypothetical protein VGG74_22255 [Kofleriaceae bacterium]|jgi:hypothetical protein